VIFEEMVATLYGNETEVASALPPRALLVSAAV
jgi:hypothetical protein